MPIEKFERTGRGIVASRENEKTSFSLGAAHVAYYHAAVLKCQKYNIFIFLLHTRYA